MLLTKAMFCKHVFNWKTKRFVQNHSIALVKGFAGHANIEAHVQGVLGECC